MNADFLVLCPYGLDAGLLSKAVELAQDTPVRILLPERDQAQAICYGAQFIHTFREETELSDERSLALWLENRVSVWQPTVILAPATVQMRSVMAMLAWLLKAGLTADCTALSMCDGRLLQTRPAFGNSLMATIRTESKLQMATVRPGTFLPVERKVDNWQSEQEDFLPHRWVTQHGFEPFTQGKPLGQAQIIVAGGAGIGSRKGFAKLEKLAKLLDAGLAASRNAVDAGYASFHSQVGMTGVTVSPELYIAVGISGAVQHLAGMSGSKTVIAINADPKAPIFDYADYGIVGDWEAVVDEVITRLSKQEETL